MKEQYFARYGNVDVSPKLFLENQIVLFVLLLLTYFSKKTFIVFIFISFISYHFMNFMRYNKRCEGIYIDENDICCMKSDGEKKIQASDIKALKITRSQSNILGMKYYTHNSDKRQLYSIILLKEPTEEMAHYDKGNLSFIRKFKDSVICYCVYDEYLIEVIKERNPDAVIMSDMR